MPSLPTKILLLCLLALASLTASARKATVKFNAAPADTMRIDSRQKQITDSTQISESLRLSGYDKAREATRESIFATNLGASPITFLLLEIEYLSIDGRQMHSRRVKISCHIPAGETRLLDFKSWDKQHSFYYYQSRAPRTSASSPYKVIIRPLSLTLAY